MELAEAASRCDHPEIALDALLRLDERTRAAGTDWALGTLARSQALVSDGELADSLYREAIERLGRTRIVVHLARTRLLYGEWLRREHRRVHAREQLRTAHEMFSRMGAGVTEYLVHHDGLETQTVRLDTTWTIDRPESASSLRFGDSISGVSAWGGAVRFGGIQWASNYTTRPSFITMPLPGLGGESALPSTLDVYVDNMLRMQSSLPSGPFRVNDVPVITGEGDIRLVVRDLLGRQQVINQPYYASPELLRAGLQEFSLETGVTRDNFAIDSNDYGRPLVVATDRVGLTNRFTGEVHGELLQEQQTFGLSGSTLLSSLGVLDASVAGSHSQHGQGQLFGLGFQRSAHRLSLGANIQYTTRDFVRLGMMPNGPAPRVTSQLFASVGLGHLGSLSVSR